MSCITDGQYFMWEDTGKELTRELVNFKFHVHKIIPPALRQQVFTELDAAVDKALTSAHNFDQLDEYEKMNMLYSEFSREIDDIEYDDKDDI